MTEKSAKDGIKPVIITADSRESRSGIALKLQNLPGVSLEQAELTSGDYLIGPGVAVERKAASDFVISLMEGRLFDQLARMAIEHERAIVLVEGNIYETRSAISPESLDGALSYISLLSGASLIHSPSLARTPYILHRMPGAKYLVFGGEAKDGLHVVNETASATAREAESIQPDDYIAGVVVVVPREALA